MRILETVLYAEDLERAHAFYTGVLGLEVIVFNPDRHLFLRCENGVLIVFKASKTLMADAGLLPHGTTGPGHMAFAATDEELEDWSVRLERAGVMVEQEVEWPNGAKSIYFRDPAGNILEFATPRQWDMS